MSLPPRILLTSLLVAGTAVAQTGRPGPQRPNRNAPPAAATPAETEVPLADRIQPGGFIEPKLNGATLAELYSRLTGRRLTVSNAAIAAEFRFVQPGDISYGEAARLLKIAALVEGFIIVPSGPNDDKLIYAPANLTPGKAGLPVITNAADLPEDDRMVTYIMPLKFIKPDDAKKTFDAIMTGANAQGSITSVPNASALIISDSTPLIRSLLDIQAKIDILTSIKTEFIKIQYADVTELADTLNQLVGNQGSGSSGSSAPRNNATPNGPPGIPVSAEGGAGETIPIQIVPNARTNDIFVMGRPADIVFVEGLVKGFDTQTDQKNFLRRKLRFVAVSDFIPVAQQALERTFSSGQGGAQGSGANFGQGGQGNRNQQGTQGNRGTSGQTASTSRTSSTSSTSSTGSGSSSGSGTTGSGSSGGLGNPDVSTAPTAQLVGRTLLVADNITNSIVIQGPPSSLEVINHLLDQIDVKPQQVMISCVFGQLRLDDTKSFGVDYLRTLNVNGKPAIAGRGGSGTGSVIPLDGTTAFNPGTLASTTGLGVYGKIGPYLNVYLQAMQTDEKFTVLSRPTVFVANNQKGSITSGTKIAIPTGSYNGGVSSGISTNFDYRDVDLKLEVIPLVNSDKEVSLQIYLTSQDLGSNRTVGEFSIPDILDRELLTNVTVPNNETIVLGGLITSHDDRTKNGIPLLSQIPLIGGLFGTNSVTKSRDELLIFIQPKIVTDSSTLYDANADMTGRYKVDDLGRDFIEGQNNPPVRNIAPPVVDPKTSKKTTTTTTTKTTTRTTSDSKKKSNDNLPASFNRP